MDPRQLVAEMTELAGGLAHELRNPLSTMMINLKLLSEDLANPRVDCETSRRRALGKVDGLRKEAERLQSLFDEFLRLMSPYQLERRVVDLNAVARRLIDFFEPLANSHRIEIQFEPRSETLPCEVDEDLLRQALLNLLINAQQAMPDSGVITLTTERDSKEAVIRIRDTGVGIALADLQRIFRPFFSTKRDGNGLGLSITRRIIQEHGGRLDVESEVGRGTTMTIRLPLGNAPMQAP